jgi:DNA-3-methyladenine glycosylase II
MTSKPKILLTEENLPQGVLHLANTDSDLNRIYQSYGMPPLWRREKGFATLVRIILEQQVSLVSAEAAFNKLLALGTLSPANLLQYDDLTLKQAGFSRQKTAYVRYLATAIVNQDLDLDGLENLEYHQAHNELTKLKGIGDWTANIYLLMALGYADIFPHGDLALVLAMQEVKRLPARPDRAEVALISAEWQPWRSVAAFMLWHYYLSQKRNVISSA